MKNTMANSSGIRKKEMKMIFCWFEDRHVRGKKNGE